MGWLIRGWGSSGFLFVFLFFVFDWGCFLGPAGTYHHHIHHRHHRHRGLALLDGMGWVWLSKVTCLFVFGPLMHTGMSGCSFLLVCVSFFSLVFTIYLLLLFHLAGVQHRQRERMGTLFLSLPRRQGEDGVEPLGCG